MDLRRETEQAREESGRFGIELLAVEQQGRQATATVRVTRPSGAVDLPLQLRRKGDGWVVVQTFQVCLLIGCP